MKQEQAIIEAEIGKRIKSFRTQKRITLEQLANQAGFTKGYLSKVEKSKKSLPRFHARNYRQGPRRHHLGPPGRECAPHIPVPRAEG
jgi:DNA-binding XRE family transcriptional regulator